MVNQVRRSRISQQPYLFEFERKKGCLYCYRVSEPTPGAEYELFTILKEDTTIQRFEIDTSHDPEFDFDILFTLGWDTDLVLVQVNLGNKEIRRRSVPKPPEYSYTS